MTTIGILHEQHLHAALKDYLSKPGDLLEQKVDNYHIDIVRGDLLIEIQTGNFSALRTKLPRLLEHHPMLLIYPVAQTKWIVRTTKRGREISRRRSPKRGRVENLFEELLYIPKIAQHPNFTFVVLLTQQEEIWRDDGLGSWRRKHWSIADRSLLDVLDEFEFKSHFDFLKLLPADLPVPFTHKQLALALGLPIWLSTRMGYCLRKMGLLEVMGKKGREFLLSPLGSAIQSASNGKNRH